MALFGDFENGHIAADQVHTYILSSLNPQNLQVWPPGKKKIQN